MVTAEAGSLKNHFMLKVEPVSIKKSQCNWIDINNKFKEISQSSSESPVTYKNMTDVSNLISVYKLM